MELQIDNLQKLTASLKQEKEFNILGQKQLNAELAGKMVHLETLQQTLNDASAQNDGLETQLSNIRTTLIRTQEEYIERTETLRVERDTLAAELVALQHNSKTCQESLEAQVTRNTFICILGCSSSCLPYTAFCCIIGASTGGAKASG
ncbi:hypothetical protein BC830DRAFT_1172547 [Chytriomyces sp. MP71]|nr:hypothetical protein BC830DRAFT_1172547 [Chytriomyces sp. MP71]